MGELHLSIVIPVFNEEQRIKPSLVKILDYFQNKPFKWEILLVDDGSKDKGISLAKEILKNKEEFRVISYGENRGKGYALKQGVLASHGKYILFTDADLATPIDELDKMLPWFEPNSENNGYDIVQGSRKMIGATIEQHQPWLRESLGKVFTWLSNKVANSHVSDVTCGFKCYRREIGHQIYAFQHLYDWSFDSEIIFIARKYGYKIKEVPVHWHDVRGTKVRLIKDVTRSLKGLLLIRINNWRGNYSSREGAIANFESVVTEYPESK
ncbi:dolichyl-phosphate beta-glucosyltransferase [Candidatus Chlorohelix sp.]|uniref:dolichyl-phosphate beta-glucosyltransferase n=1 Tax=Candidatus Chlorohelix sp. TaxID=3139201 RepID=UPI003029ADF7